MSFSYTVQKNRRSKNLRLTITPAGEVKVTMPWYLPKLAADHFVRTNRDWILDRLKRLPKIVEKTDRTTKDITDLKIKTRNLVRERLDFFNKLYGFTFHRITIRDQSTRWGSCSSNKTLSFNYRLCLLPPELADYVIVHELCHLKEMNHSHHFWAEVSRAVPHFRSLRRQLHTYDNKL